MISFYQYRAKRIKIGRDIRAESCREFPSLSAECLRDETHYQHALNDFNRDWNGISYYERRRRLEGKTNQQDVSARFFFKYLRYHLATNSFRG